MAKLCLSKRGYSPVWADSVEEEGVSEIEVGVLVGSGVGVLVGIGIGLLGSISISFASIT